MYDMEIELYKNRMNLNPEDIRTTEEKEKALAKALKMLGKKVRLAKKMTQTTFWLQKQKTRLNNFITGKHEISWAENPENAESIRDSFNEKFNINGLLDSSFGSIKKNVADIQRRKREGMNPKTAEKLLLGFSQKLDDLALVKNFFTTNGLKTDIVPTGTEMKSYEYIAKGQYRESDAYLFTSSGKEHHFSENSEVESAKTDNLDSRNKGVREVIKENHKESSEKAKECLEWIVEDMTESLKNKSRFDRAQEFSQPIAEGVAHSTYKEPSSSIYSGHSKAEVQILLNRFNEAAGTSLTIDGFEKYMEAFNQRNLKTESIPKSDTYGRTDSEKKSMNDVFMANSNSNPSIHKGNKPHVRGFER